MFRCHIAYNISDPSIDKYPKKKGLLAMKICSVHQAAIFRCIFLRVKMIFVTFIVKRKCERTSDSLNEGLPIKMTREKFQRK